MRGTGNIAEVTSPGSGTYNRHVLYANATEFGLEAALATDAIGGAKLPIDITWRGGYPTQGGLRLTGPASAALGGNTILHATNFNSYAPTLTGTGASGSWGISVTGSSASTTGNAATATALQNARTIGGVSFNGTANIDLPGVNTAGNQNTTGSAATLTTARTINGVSFNGSANITISQTKATDNRIVIPTGSSAGYSELLFTSWNNNNTSPYADALHLRTYNDGTGGADNLVMFSKSGIGMRIWQQTFGSSSAYATFKDVAFTDSSITGNAATATTLQTARTIGGVSFNGSANIDLPGVNTAGNQNTSGNAATATNATQLGGKTSAYYDDRTINALGSISGTTNINLANGTNVTATIAGATTFTVSGLTSGSVNTITLLLTNAGAHSVTFPSGTTFNRNTAPILAASGNTIIVLETYDTGTSYKGIQVWRDTA